MVVEVADGLNNFQNRARLLMENRDLSTVLTNSVSRAELNAFFRNVDVAFADADGTVVEEGMTELPGPCLDAISSLAQDIKVFIVTGKPYEEARRLLDGMAKKLPIEVIYEKGAYRLRSDSLGVKQKEYLLTNP